MLILEFGQIARKNTSDDSKKNMTTCLNWYKKLINTSMKELTRILIPCVIYQ